MPWHDTRCSAVDRVDFGREWDVAVLVTGGAGFVGLNLVEALLAAEESVVALDTPRNVPRLRHFDEKAGGRLAVAEGDVCDPSFLSELFRTHSIEGVIHAAVVTAGASREASAPDAIIDVNLKGPVAVLRAGREAGCRNVVYVGSGAAYGRAHLEADVLHEDVSPSRPEDLYGLTKFAAEGIVRRLGDLWGIGTAGVRLGSVFGPWEFDSGVRDSPSPQFQAAALAARGEAAILPATEIRRDWMYSRDVADGLLAVLRRNERPHRLYHLTSGEDWSGAFARYCDLLGQVYPDFSWRRAEPGETPNVSFLYDTDRAHMANALISQDTGFRPGFKPDAAYADYVAWLGAHAELVFPGRRWGEGNTP